MAAVQVGDQKKIVSALHLYGRLWDYVKGYWGALTIAAIASMCYSGVDAWFVYFLKPLLNKGLVEKNQHFLVWAPYLVLMIFILRGVASFFSNYYIAHASRSVIMHLRQDLFAHLQRLPAKYYDHNTSGSVLSVLIYGVEQVANASADVLTTTIQAVFLVLGLTIVMFSISWKLTLMYFVLLPMVMIIMRIASMRVRRISLSINDAMQDISHVAEENIEGYKVVRAFEGQTYEIAKFNKAARVFRQREMKMVVARSLSATSVQLITAGALSITLYIATLDVAGSLLSPGGFVAMIAAMLALLKPIKDLAFAQNKLFRGLAGAQNVFELIDVPCEIDSGTRSLERAYGALDFSHVSFSYADGQSVLKDVSFSVRPGTVVALVGHSGSGKSTLISLLPRYYTGYTGTITLDGCSIDDYQLKDLRRQFAIVSQQVTLFHDTIRNNIAYGQFSDVSEEDIIRVAKASHAWEFIQSMPDGLDTLIGENGVLLSGGQRQRIAIARAILKDAPILILDEATSSLDTESERYIQAALEELMKTRTTLVIAHRLSTVEHADQIIVMEAGQIVEQGNHHHLLAMQGHYAKLYRMQFKDAESEVNDDVAI